MTIPPTPLQKLDGLYLKREDLNPTGSAKDRSLSLQIESLIRNHITQAVISSTGNAAISAAHFCHQQGIGLTVFVSHHIQPAKLAALKRLPLKLITSAKPISDAFKLAKTGPALLRQSTDPVALDGYETIGAELKNQLSSISSLFIPVGSGTTLLGISRSLPAFTKIYAVQPAANPTITRRFDTVAPDESQTVTDALSVKLLPLKHQIIKAITDSGGSGLTITDSQVRFHWRYLLANGINCSPEAGLALAGYHKAIEIGLPVGSHPVILVTGTNR